MSIQKSPGKPLWGKSSERMIVMISRLGSNVMDNRREKACSLKGLQNDLDVWARCVRGRLVGHAVLRSHGPHCGKTFLALSTQH